PPRRPGTPGRSGSPEYPREGPCGPAGTAPGRTLGHRREAVAPSEPHPRVRLERQRARLGVPAFLVPEVVSHLFGLEERRVELAGLQLTGLVVNQHPNLLGVLVAELVLLNVLNPGLDQPGGIPEDPQCVAVLDLDQQPEGPQCVAVLDLDQQPRAVLGANDALHQVASDEPATGHP